MSFFSGTIETSLAQLAQTQRTAAEGRDRERARSETARRASDSVTLRVAGLEHPAAVRGSENDDLEEQDRRPPQQRGGQDRVTPEQGDLSTPEGGSPPIDLKA